MIQQQTWLQASKHLHSPKSQHTQNNDKHNGRLSCGKASSNQHVNFSNYKRLILLAYNDSWNRSYKRLEGTVAGNVQPSLTFSPWLSLVAACQRIRIFSYSFISREFSKVFTTNRAMSNWRSHARAKKASTSWYGLILQMRWISWSMLLELCVAYRTSLTQRQCCDHRSLTPFVAHPTYTWTFDELTYFYCPPPYPCGVVLRDNKWHILLQGSYCL